MLAFDSPRRLVSAHRPRLLASVALLGLACGASGAEGASAAGAGPACSPPGGSRSAQLARAVRPDGSSEVTEFVAGGEYRVTRCGSDGRLLVSQTVSPILDPDGGTVLVPTERTQPGVTVAILYGDPAEPGWAASFRAARAELRASAIPPTVAPPAPAVALPLPVLPSPPDAGNVGGPKDPVGPRDPGASRDPGGSQRPGGSSDPGGTKGPGVPSPAGATGSLSPSRGQAARAAVAGDACTNPQFRFWETAWETRDYSYRINRSRFSYNDTTVASLVAGHRNWDTTFNSCGLNDITNLTSHHLGSTSETIHTGPDSLSVTDRGSLASICPGALACTWLFADAAAHTTETDQRFNESIAFSNVGAAGAYDYESIATHETGHSIGLDHANSSNALTMYFQIGAGTTHARSLAKGDVLGLRARYP